MSIERDVRVMTTVLGDEWRAWRRTFYVPPGAFLRSAEVFDSAEGVMLIVRIDCPLTGVPTDASNFVPVPVFVSVADMSAWSLVAVYENHVPMMAVGLFSVGNEVADIRVPKDFFAHEPDMAWLVPTAVDIVRRFS